MVICVANNDFKVKLIFLSINITKYSYNLKYDNFPTRKPTFANMSEYLHEILHNMNMVVCVVNNDFTVVILHVLFL